MRRSRSVRAAALAAACGVIVSVAPTTAAWTGPVIVQNVPFADVVARDIAIRGAAVAVTADIRAGAERDATLAWSTDGGQVWSTLGLWPASQVLETEVTICEAVELGGSSQRGRGYRSANGGASFAQVSSHASGRVVAGVFGSSTPDWYAEVWDGSITKPAPQRLRYRMDVPSNVP